MGGIIWLASYPKSGNTWMRAFLHNLLRDPDKPMPINEIDKFTLGDASAGWYKRFTSKAPHDLTLEELAALRPKVHAAFTRSFPDSVFVKTHNYLGESGGAPLISMQYTAGSIYIVRNPLDVVSSFAAHFGVPIDEAITTMSRPGAMSAPTPETHTVLEVFNSWSINVKSWTQIPHPRLHVVRYEDLLEKPNRTFMGVANFLGLRPPPDRVKKAIKFSSFRELKKQEEKQGFKERSVHAPAFFRSGKSGTWRDKLTEEQVRRIVEDHGEQMRRFDYIPKDYA